MYYCKLKEKRCMITKDKISVNDNGKTIHIGGRVDCSDSFCVYRGTENCILSKPFE